MGLLRKIFRWGGKDAPLSPEEQEALRLKVEEERKQEKKARLLMAGPLEKKRLLKELAASNNAQHHNHNGQSTSSDAKNDLRFRTDYPAPSSLELEGSYVAVLDDPTGEGNPDSELIAASFGELDLSNIEDDDTPVNDPALESEIDADADADDYGDILIEQGVSELEDRANWQNSEILAHDNEIILQEEETARVELERAEAERLAAIGAITQAVVAHKECEEKAKPARINVKKGESAPVSFFREMFNLLGLKASPKLPERVTDLYNDNAKGVGHIVMDRRNQGGKVSTIESHVTNVVGDNDLAPVEALSVVKELYLRKAGKPIDLWVKKGGQAKTLKQFNPKNVHDIAMMQLACEVQNIPVSTDGAIEKLKAYKKFDENGVAVQDNEAIFARAQKEYKGYLEALKTSTNMGRDFEHVRRMDEIITTFPALQLS